MREPVLASLRHRKRIVFHLDAGNLLEGGMAAAPLLEFPETPSIQTAKLNATAG
jgi:hypothetical protein